MNNVPRILSSSLRISRRLNVQLGSRTFTVKPTSFPPLFHQGCSIWYGQRGDLPRYGWELRTYSTTHKKEQAKENINLATTSSPPPQPITTPTPSEPELRESPYTLPNALTTARLLSCPFLGWSIVTGQFELATGILVAGGISDLLDGWIARRFNMKSVLGTILDPAADKALMTTLVITLAWEGMLPLPLAVLILGRDVALSISAFYYRYISLPAPKTFKRYWDFSIPSAEVRPTTISKYNTALQLLLMGVTTISPLIGADISIPLQALQWTVAGTTIWSGLSYVGSKDAVKILTRK